VPLPFMRGTHSLTRSNSRTQDTHDLLEEQETRVSAKIQTTQDSLDKVSDELHGLHDKLEASAEHIVAKVDDVAKDLSQESTRLEEHTHSAAAELSSRLDRLDAKASQLNDQRALECERTATKLAELGQDVQRRNDALDRSFAKQMTDLSASVGLEVANASGAADRACDQLRVRLDRAVEMLEGKISTGAQTSAARADSAVLALEAKVTAGFESTDASLQQLDEKVDGRVNSAQETLSAQMQALWKSVTEGLADANARLDEEVHTAYTRATAGLDKVDGAMSRVDAKVDVTTQALQQRIDERFALLDSRLTATGLDAQQARSKLGTRADTLESQLRQLLADASIEKDATNASMQNLDAKVSDAVKRLDVEIAVLQQQHTDLSRETDKRMSEKSAALAENVQSHYKHFTDRCDAISSALTDTSTELTSRASELDNRLLDLATNTDVRFTAAEDRDAAQTALFREQHEGMQLQLRETCDTMDHRLASGIEEEAQKRKADAQALGERCSELDQRAKSKAAELTTAIDEMQRSVTATTNRMEQSLADQILAVEAVLKGKAADQQDAIRQLQDDISLPSSGLRPRLDAVDTNLAQLKTFATDNFAAVDSRCRTFEVGVDARFENCREQLQELGVTVAANHDAVSALCRDIDSKFIQANGIQDARMDRLDQRIDEDRQHFEKVCFSLDRAQEEQNQHLVARCESLDESFAEKYGLCDMRIEKLHVQLTDRCGNLDRRLENHAAQITERCDNDVQQLRDLCANLDQKYAGKATVHETQMMELSSTTQRHYSQLNDMCENVGATAVARADAQDQKIDQLGASTASQLQVLSSACSDLERKHTEATAAQADQSERHYQHFADLCATLQLNLDASAETCAHDLDVVRGTARQYQQHFGEKIEALNQRFTQQNTAQDTRTEAVALEVERNKEHYKSLIDSLSQKSTTKAEQQDHQINQLGKSVQMFESAFTQRCADLENSMTDKLEAQATRMVAHHNSFTATCGTLDNKLVESGATINSRLEDLRRHVEERGMLVEQQATQRHADLESEVKGVAESLQKQHEYFTDVCGKLDRKFGTELEVHGDKLSRQHAHFEHAYENLTKTSTSNYAALDGRVAQLRDSLQHQHQQLSDAHAKLGHTLEAAAAATKQANEVRFAQITEHATELSTACSSVESNLSSRLAAYNEQTNQQFLGLKSTCDAMESKFDLKVAAHDERITTQNQHFSQIISDLDSKQTNKNKVQDARAEDLSQAIKDMHTHFTNEVDSAREQFRGKSSEQDILIDKHYQHFTDVCSNLDVKFQDANRNLDAKVDELNMSVDDKYRNLVDTCETLHKQFVEKAAAQDERAERQYKHFTSVCRDLNKKIDEDSARQDGRTDDLALTAQQHYDHFTEANSNLDSKFTSKTFSLNEKIDAVDRKYDECRADHEKRFGQWRAEDHERFTSLLKAMDQRVIEQCSNLEGRVDKADALIREHYQHFTTLTGDMERQFTHSCKQLEHKMTQDISALDDRIETHRQHVLESCQDIQSTFTDQTSVLDSRVTDTHAYFSNLCAKIDLKLVQETDKVSDTEQQHFTQLLGKIGDVDTKLTSSAADQSAKTDAAIKSIQGNMQTFESVCQKMDQAAEDQRQHVQNKLSFLEEALNEKYHACGLRIETLETSDVCANMESKLMEKIAAQDARMETSRQHLLDLCNNLDQKFSEKIEAHESQMTETNGLIMQNHSQVIGMCEDFRTTTAERADAQDLRMDRLSDAVEEHHRHFTETARTLDKKFTEENASIHELIKEHHAQLTEACGRVEQETAAKDAAQDELIESHLNHFNNLHTDTVALITSKLLEQGQHFDKQLTSVREDGEDHVRDVCAELDEKFEQRLAAQAESIDANAAQQAADLKSVQSDLSDRIAGQASQMTDLERVVQSHHSHFSSAVGSLDEKCTIHIFSIRDAITKLVEKNCSQDAEAQKIRAMTVEVQSVLERAHSELEHKLAAEAVTREDAVREVRTHIHALCADLEQRLETSTADSERRSATLSAAVQEQREAVRASAEQLRQDLDARMSAQASQQLDQHEQTMGTIEDLRRATDEQVSAHTEALQRMKTAAETSQAENEKRFRSLTEKVDVAAAEQHKLLQQQHTHFTDAIREAEQRQEADATASKSTVADLRRQVETNHTRVDQDLNQANSKLAQLSESLRERLDAVTGHSAEMRANLEQKLVAKNTLQDARMDVISGLVQEHFTLHSAAHDSLKKTVVEAHAALDRRCEEQHTSLRAALQAFEKQVADKQAGQDARMDDLSSADTDNFQTLSSQLDAFEAQFSKKNESQDERVEILLKALSAKDVELNDKWQERITLVDERVTGLASLVHDSREQLMSSCADLDRKFTEKNLSQDEAMEEKTQHAIKLCEANSKQLIEVRATAQAEAANLMNTVTAQHDKLTAECKDLDSKFLRITSTQDTRMEDQKAHLVELNTNLDNKTSAALANHADRLDTLDSNLQQHELQTNDACKSLRLAITEENQAQDERFRDSSARMLEMHEAYQNATDLKMTELDQSLNATISTQEQHHQFFTDLCANLDNKHTDKSAHLSQSLDNLRLLVTDSVAACEERCAEMFDSHKKMVDSSMSALDKKTAQKFELHDTTIGELNSTLLSHHKHFTTTCGNLSKQLLEETGELSTRLDSNHLHTTDTLAKAQAQHNSTTAELTARVGTLDTSLQDYHRHFQYVCDKLDAIVAEEVATRKERVEELHEHFSNLCSTMDTKFTDTSTAQDIRIDELAHTQIAQNASLTSSINKLSSDVSSDKADTTHRLDSLQTHFAGLCSQLDTKIADVKSAGDDRADKLHEFITDSIAGVTESQLIKNAAQDARADEQAADLESKFNHCVELNSSLDGKFTQRFDSVEQTASEIADSVVSQREECLQLISELDEQVTQEVKKAEVQLNSSLKALESKTSAADAKLAGQIADLDQQLSQRCAMHSDRMDRLADVVSSNHAHFTVVCSNIEQKLAETAAALKSVLDDYRNQAVAACASLDQKISDTLSVQSARIDTNHAHFTSVCDHNSARITEARSDLESKLLDSCRVLESKITETNSLVNDRVDAEHQHFANACTEVERRFTEQHSELDEKCTAEWSKLQSQVSEALEAHETSLQNTHDHFEKACSTLDEKLCQMVGEVDSRVTPKLAQVHDETVSLGDTLAAHNSHFGDMCAKLDTRISDECATLTDRVDDQRRYVDSAISKLADKTAEEVRAQDERLKEHHRHFSEVWSRLDTKLSDSAAELHSTIKDLVTVVDDKYGTITHEHSDLIATHKQELMAKSDAISMDLSARCLEIEGQATAQDAAHSQRADELASDLVKQREHFINVISGIDQKFSSQNKLQDEHAVDQHERLTAAYRALSDKLVEQVQLLNDKAVEKNAVQDERTDMLSGMVEDYHEQHASMCAGLDQKFTNQDAARAAKIEEYHGELSRRTDKVDSTLTAKLDAHADRLEGFHSHFADLSANLDTKIVNETSRLGAQCEDVARQNQSVITDKCASLAQRIDSEHSHFTELNSFLDQKASNELAVTAERLSHDVGTVRHSLDEKCTAIEEATQAHHVHFSQLCSELDQRVTAEIRELDRRCADRSIGQDNRLDELTGAVHDHHAHFTRAVAAQVKVSREKMSALEETQEQQHEKLSVKCAEVEKHVFEELGRTSERLEDYSRDAATALANLGTRCTNISSELDTKFTDHCGRLEEKLSQAGMDQAAQLQRAQQQLANSCASLDQKFSSVFGELDEKFTEKAGEGDQRMDGLSSNVGRLDDKFSKMYAQLNKKYSQKETAQDELIEDHRQYFSTVITKVERKFAEETAALDHRLTDTSAHAHERLDEVSSTVEEHHDHFTAVGANLDRRFTDSISSVDSRSKEMFAHFTDVASKLDSKIDSERQELDATIESQRHEMVASASSLEQRLTNESAALDSKFTDCCSTLDERSSEANQVLERKLTEGIRGSQEATAALEQKLEAGLAELGASLADQVGTVDARADELWSTVEDHHSHFTEVCARLDAKCTERVGALGAQLDAEHAHSEELVAGLGQQLGDQLEQLQQRLIEKHASQDERVDELGAMISEHHGHFTEICQKLDRKFVDKNSEQDECIEKHRKYFTAVCSKLDSKHTAKTTSLEEQAQASTQAQAEATSRLDDKFTAEVTDLDARLAASTGRLERAVADHATAQGTRMDQEHVHFTDAIARLDQKWLDEWSSFDQNTATALADTSTRLETLATAVQTHYEQGRQEAAKAAATTDERLTLLEKRTAEEHRQVSEAMSQLVSGLSSEQRELEKRCTQAASECDGRVDMLAQALQGQSESFNHGLLELDRKFTDSGAVAQSRQQAVEEQVSSLQARIQQNDGTRTLDLSAAQNSLDRLATKT
jgi:DNA repair exonuclease SbcCD ATPase subunit